MWSRFLIFAPETDKQYKAMELRQLKYFVKSPKIAVLPLVLMSALCIFVPSMISQTSILMIPSGGLALAIGFFLFKKGKL